MLKSGLQDDFVEHKIEEKENDLKIFHFQKLHFNTFFLFLLTFPESFLIALIDSFHLLMPVNMATPYLLEIKVF